MAYNAYYSTITNCYSTGSVSGNYRVGGLVGDYDGKVSDSFWDIETSGQTTSARGTGKTTAELQTASTFAAWGCGSIWTIDSGKDYPRLWWQNMPGEIISKPYYGGGNGETNDPYLIYTAEQLNTIGLATCDWDKHFRLMADIDLSSLNGTSFNIIGTFWANPFTGVFDGIGHTISNFNYIYTATDSIGFFGYVRGVIKDLGLIDPNVDAGTGRDVGSLVGDLVGGTITNCYVEGGSVSGVDYVGGLVGSNGGTITNCYSTASVWGDRYVGGLVGSNSGTITNCYSTGSVWGDQYVGGLVGLNGRWCIGGTPPTCYYGTIINCYSTGSVSGYYSVGGLVGSNDGEVSASFWDIETGGPNNGIGTPLPTEQMQMASTFTDAGWDFNTPVWTIDEGVDYPRLWWEFVPVLHAEPELTLGTSNTISWYPVVGDVEYYAECAEDANFTWILYNTGWITETSCEFSGLEIGKRYWYSVKARNAEGTETDWSNVESSLQCTLADAVEIELEPESLKNENMKNALLNKIDAALKMIEEANYTGALSKLQNDILQKTNGCAETDQPDKNDWIITCEQQCEIYPLIIETIEHVKGLMQ